MGKGERSGGNQTKTNQGGVGGNKKKRKKLHTLDWEKNAAPNCCQQLSGCTISLPYGLISKSELRFLAQKLHRSRIPSISSYIFRHVVCCLV